jgi:5-methyltetrahydrofolate--homocysteine methyltransferase
MATVKGDVHDIGKNIVGVVLGCNNYEIVDLGVMVPAHEILKKAKEENVDIIGLSGLITPSLDEMVNIAKEMERQEFKIPLLIGGATTSRIHTALKIDPEYSGPVIHVLDASRSVGVASSLLSEQAGKSEDFILSTKEEYNKARINYASRKGHKKYLSLEEARKNKLSIDWNKFKPVTPVKLELVIIEDMSIETLIDYIDWTPFFLTWQLRGKYPQIFDNKVIGEEAQKLYSDAQSMLTQIIDNKWLTAKGVARIFPAASEGDDILLFKNASSKEILERLKFHRQQAKKANGQANLCLADFVAPTGNGKVDYMGAFAVTTGLGIEKIIKKFEAEHDDYSSIMIKAIADRLAEAFAEYLHEKVRKDIWAYQSDENLDILPVLNTAKN